MRPVRRAAGNPARPDGIDPRVLLLWLRSEDGRAAVQACITGQTAHLHPEYVLDVIVPHEVLSADASQASELVMSALAARREAERLEDEARAAFERAVPVALRRSRRAA